MDILNKIPTSLPKNKLRRQADIKIRLKLYKIIFLSYIKNLLTFSAWEITPLNKILTISFAAIALFCTTSFYAYASGNIIPGNQLYPLKIAIEKIEEKINFSDSAKIATYEKFSARRLQEAVNLSSKNEKNKNKVTSENIKKNILAEIDNHEAVAESINKLNNSAETDKVINRAKENDQAEVDYLDKIAEYAQSNNDEDILRAVKEAKEVIRQQEYKYLEKNKENEKEEKEEKYGENINKSKSKTEKAEKTSIPEINKLKTVAPSVNSEDKKDDNLIITNNDLKDLNESESDNDSENSNKD